MLTHRNLVANALICRDHFELTALAHLRRGAALPCHGLRDPACCGFRGGRRARADLPLPSADSARRLPRTQADLHHRRDHGFHRAHESSRTPRAAISRASRISIPAARRSRPRSSTLSRQRFGRAIRSSYGMTELTAPSHLAPNDGVIPVDPQSGALSIGYPTPGTDAIIVDEARRPLGAGEHGELVVRGPSVMAGYWRKPERDRRGSCRRLDAHRRHRLLRRGGLVLSGRPQEGHDFRLRLQGLAARGRRRALRVSRRARGRGRRRARPLSRRDRVAFVSAKPEARDRCRSAFAFLPRTPRGVQMPGRNSRGRGPAEDGDRQRSRAIPSGTKCADC